MSNQQYPKPTGRMKKTETIESTIQLFCKKTKPVKKHPPNLTISDVTCHKARGEHRLRDSRLQTGLKRQYSLGETTEWIIRSLSRDIELFRGQTQH